MGTRTRGAAGAAVAKGAAGVDAAAAAAPSGAATIASSGDWQECVDRVAPSVLVIKACRWALLDAPSRAWWSRSVVSLQRRTAGPARLLRRCLPLRPRPSPDDENPPYPPPFRPPQTTYTRSFDTDSASSSHATGFVVDRARGLVLTNRHVIGAGPVVAEGIFMNHEEVDLLPVLVDPVHDFGLLRYDPASLSFASPSSIDLRPDLARVGLDVRVLGNDSGEKLSILAGTLARLDRGAPNYGSRGYSDHNTFYLQAASGTKGGSSGSPVVDIGGNAVALNAGARNKSATGYYLPLSLVLPALRAVQAANPLDPMGELPREPVPASHAAGTRGTAVGRTGGRGAPARGATQPRWNPAQAPRGCLLTTWRHRGFEEIRRLGLSEGTERAVRLGLPLTEDAAAAAGGKGGKRAAKRGAATKEAASGLVPDSPPLDAGTGLLVVERVLPGGPGDVGGLEAGDVLLSLNGSPARDFDAVARALDGAAAADAAPGAPAGGTRVTVEVERRGRRLRLSLPVHDLHARRDPSPSPLSPLPRSSPPPPPPRPTPPPPMSHPLDLAPQPPFLQRPRQAPRLRRRCSPPAVAAAGAQPRPPAARRVAVPGGGRVARPGGPPPGRLCRRPRLPARAGRGRAMLPDHAPGGAPHPLARRLRRRGGAAPGPGG